jgi:hypothetical protein
MGAVAAVLDGAGEWKIGNMKTPTVAVVVAPNQVFNHDTHQLEIREGDDRDGRRTVQVFSSFLLPLSLLPNVTVQYAVGSETHFPLA